MKNLIFIVCCALFVKCSWCDGISIIGSKFVRPNQPYTVAVANPLKNTVTLKLSLECNEFTKEATLQLKGTSGKKVQFPVPSISSTSDCTITAINDGGDVVVNHDVTLEIPDKTVSIFIQTDKPVYKPGDDLRFRVIVVDIETKPVTNIKSIEVLIEDAHENTVRKWSFAKLNKGVFETSYQMAAAPVLGTWNITVIANDSSILNEKKKSFVVKEYVLPKFAVNVWPTKTLLIDDEKISLTIDAHYTFGEPVKGKARVNLYLDKYSSRFSHEATSGINGNTEVEFRIQNALEVNDDSDHTMVNVTVAVTDSITSATVNITQLIPVYLKPYKVTLVKPSLYYRPGADYHFKLSVKYHDGLPAEKGQMIKISIDDEEKQAKLNDRGLASFVISTPHQVENMTVSAIFADVEYDDIGLIEGLNNSSTQYFQIQPKDRIKIAKKTSFTISSNEPIAQFTYFIATRGNIVDFGHVKSKKRTTHTLNLKLTEAMAPKATLVVFFVKNGKFLADYFDLNFESFGNNFEFRLNKIDEEPYRPDEEIFVEGTAQQDSIIFFHAIDRGALLLGHTEFGLTKQEILNDLDQYQGEGRDNAFDSFNSMGLFFRSDYVDDFGSSRDKRSPHFYSHGKKQVQKAVLLRLDFPESWLWRNSGMNRKKSFEIQDFVPHTITSWYVSAFALSPTRGLGIMNYPRKFTVGKPFYMIAHLPYSIKRGEVALIQVTLYNFLGNTVTTDVKLFNKNDEIEFADKSSNNGLWRSKAIILPSHQVKAVSFLIKAKKLGEIAIKIEAVNALASDGLEHLLRVTPESKEVKKNEARFIDLGRTKTTLAFNFTCNIPRDSEAGSVKIKATIDPDLIGIPTNHSESIIKIPNGSGDLNLLTLVPNLIALEYLSSTTKHSDEALKQKAFDYLNKGYDNQLKYRSSNGAFRQWNNETGKESVFLTALVANSFVTASKHITVNPAVIKDALSWLASKQKPNGRFDEIGEVIYAPMQDSSSSVPLTAFVVAAFMENHNFSREYETMVNEAVGYLERNVDSLSSNYHKALATYALSLTMHRNKLKYLNELIKNSISINNGNERYWNEGSLSVEIAGYALLSYTAQNLPLQGMAIYKWLNRQRYASGEFAGVQSTFVGLKAMSKMAQILSEDINNYRVQISSKLNGNDYFTQHFDIEHSKALFITEHDLPDTHRVFTVEFDGNGYGVFQLSYQYHLNIVLAKPSFNLQLDLLSTSNHIVQDLKVCLSYVQHETRSTSGKTLVEIFLPSGFVVNDNSVRNLSSDRKIMNTLRSFDGSAMYVYYESLDNNQVCFVVTAYRQFKIAMHRPSYVVVYDTENRDRFALKHYEGKVLQLCDICQDEDCTSLKCDE